MSIKNYNLTKCFIEYSGESSTGYQQSSQRCWMLISHTRLESGYSSWISVSQQRHSFLRMSSFDVQSDGAASTSVQTIDGHIHEGHMRCDEDILKLSPEYFLGSAVHDTLSGLGLIEDYRVYRKEDHDEISCIVRFGDRLNGHPGIVHGGIIATALDNTFGWLFTALEYPPSFTANLSLNFRKPVMANTSVKIIAKLDEKKGRKLMMSAVMMGLGDVVLVEATALFITMQKESLPDAASQ